ncbi:MAG: zinc-ribbon domain-containing protein [gamma proteobacterium symbiont of Bathyaustriella thionipta]|nr:zinc-ribbon domain-containing protein [gamma proteobacterium symbiont of Bathyaustriella thionipta]
MPLHAIEADQSKIEMGNSYGPCPRYYVDYIYSCIDCGKKSLWTAEQQKWWYEEAKGNIN